jgi:hypothetical protein
MSKKVETIDLDSPVDDKKPVNIMEKPITDAPPPKKEKEPFNGLDLSPILNKIDEMNAKLEKLGESKPGEKSEPVVLPTQEPAIKPKPKQGKILDELDPFPEWEL